MGVGWYTKVKTSVALFFMASIYVIYMILWIMIDDQSGYKQFPSGLHKQILSASLSWCEYTMGVAVQHFKWLIFEINTCVYFWSWVEITINEIRL